MHTVRQEMHTRDCVLTGLGGHGCGHNTGGVDTGDSDSQTQLKTLPLQVTKEDIVTCTGW